MFLYVANWKMNMPFDRVKSFCEDNYDGLKDLSKLPDKKIVLCPSFTELIPVLDIFGNCDVEIGAQNCSAYISGAYTGQVSVSSLAQIGCTYCIVGHSEVREYFLESNGQMAQKVLLALESKVIPILCVGEHKEDYGIDTAKEALFKQMEPVCVGLQDRKEASVCIAYEPIWSIGTGVTPEIEYVEKIFQFIFKTGKKICPNVEMALLYGGSVNENNVKKMKCIPNLEGFLIGGASLDFKKFEKIVQL